jgi:hypothetical protein
MHGQGIRWFSPDFAADPPSAPRLIDIRTVGMGVRAGTAVAGPCRPGGPVDLMIR